MKAIYFEQGGAPDVMIYGEMPVPEIKKNQVLVRLHAAGINPIDGKIRTSPQRFPVNTPTIPGCDGAGIVEKCGSNVDTFKPGDAVYFSQPGFNQRQGTYSEYAAVDASLVAHKPESLSFADAAAAPLILITAWEALFDRAGLQAGQNVLIHAGAGGVGHVAIQLAKHASANVITTVSNEEKTALVKSLGADEIINYKSQDVLESVNSWSNGEGVDVVFDTVGASILESCFSCAKPYGDVVTILQPTADTNWGEARKRNLRFSFELMLTPIMLELENAKLHQQQILNKCAKLFDEQQLQIHRSQTFKLDQASMAHDYLENEHPSGKLVLQIQ